MDEHDTCSMRPSHRTADAEGSPDCQSSFHCAFSPAHVTSCLEAECVCSTSACSRNELLAWNFLREAPFPIPSRRDGMSHPITACRKSMC